MTNRKRSLLTMLGIIIGITSVITIISLGNGVKKATLKNLQATKTGKQTVTIDYYANDSNDYQAGFDQADHTLLKSKNDLGVSNVKIQRVTKEFQITAVIFDTNKNLTATAVKDRPGVRLIAGKNISSYDNSVQNQRLLISKQTALKNFKSIKGALGASILINGLSYTVVGIYANNNESPYDTNLILPQGTYFQGQVNDQGNSVQITFSKGSKISKNTEHLVTLLKKKGSHRNKGEYSFTDMGELLSGIGKVISALTYFVSAIAGISLFIAGIGVMNMMYISVSERTQEIGIRLAVGASPRDIMNQFLLEAVLLTTFGGLIGFGLGVGSAWLFSLLLPFKAVTTFGSFILAFSVSTIVGIIFGILPAKQAANKNLIDILK
nr:ABC transporter permease [Oenococcus oeni]